MFKIKCSSIVIYCKKCCIPKKISCFPVKMIIIIIYTLYS